jgi:hypothetical protein
LVFAKSKFVINLFIQISFMKESKTTHPFGKLGNPAQRALANAGIETLEQLSKLTQAGFMKLHGVGKAALPIVKVAMAEKGLSFANT